MAQYSTDDFEFLRCVRDFLLFIDGTQFISYDIGSKKKKILQFSVL